MLIYLDDEYRCHVSGNGADMMQIETDFFDGKCRKFIEGYRYVPEGESWKREDGVLFVGTMIAPWRDYEMLEELQAQYEESQTVINDLSAALDIIYSGVTESEAAE